MLLLLGWAGLAGHGGAWRSGAPRWGRSCQQLQQQQQPAVRHRSTARRLVSISSRRAVTTHTIPV